VTLTEEVAPDPEAEAQPGVAADESAPVAETASSTAAAPAETPVEPAQAQDDLGEVFGRVMALSMMLNHPAFQRAIEGFADRGRVYLVYRDEQPMPLSRRAGGLRMSEADAIAVAIQVCQAVSFVNRRGLRVNDLCPESVVFGANGRIKLTGLDYISNDTELQGEPLFNDGYTAPEIYQGAQS
jgi:serine/threonine protein kinase